ncbi:MAG: hypothetical protein HY360_14340 [Verrucomicrobia bacterium]|nr:hypothetical protein [Verrucomicrobiota bacterium]
MSTVDELKAAAATLAPSERYELLKWLTSPDEVHKIQIEELRREIAIGIDQMEQDQYKAYDGKSLNELVKEVCVRGRKKLVQPKRNR